MFRPQYFKPKTAKILAKFANSRGSIPVKMYAADGIVEYDIPGYDVFLPKSILNEHKFGRLPKEAQKKMILNLMLSEEDLFTLIRALGGSIRKKISSPPPTLGDLFKDL